MHDKTMMTILNTCTVTSQPHSSPSTSGKDPLPSLIDPEDRTSDQEQTKEIEGGQGLGLEDSL